MTTDRIEGALRGAAIGNALAMPVDQTGHDYVRMFYGGIKEYRDDERRRDLKAGQWTFAWQATLAIAEALQNIAPPVREAYRHHVAEGRRWPEYEIARIEGTTNEPMPPRLAAGASARMAPLGIWWVARDEVPEDELFSKVQELVSLTHPDPGAFVIAAGQAWAVRELLRTDEGLPSHFWRDLVTFTRRAEATFGAGAAVSTRLESLRDHLRDFPLDLRDRCGDIFGVADESWPFVMAMFVRNPGLVEATLLSAINCGGDTVSHGTMLGSLLGALHGYSAFPEAWRSKIEE